jgi:outer membrane murein-binding lipoprotein Lpp
MDELNRRNTETVRQTIKDMSDQVFAQQVKIDGLNSTITTLNSRIDNLERTVNLLRAMLMGSGPTAR